MQNTLPIGAIIRGRYLVQETLGKSDSGAVYLLRDQHNNFNLLVLKEVINPNKHKLYRLSIEGMSLRLLYHQALPHVYNVFSEGKHDRVYILMDYIEGPNMQMVRLQQPEKRFSFPQAMTIMLPIMEAVTYLHSQHPPIIHMDIKPINIIVPTTSDRAKLVDYGISKKYNLDVTSPAQGRSLTAYEAPELHNEEPSTLSDIYGLGATFYTLLTGSVPVDALSRKNQLESKGSDPLEPVNKVIHTLSLPIIESIQRAMSLSSNDRFSTVGQFVQALQVDPTWKLSPIEKREFDQALKAASTVQISSEPFIISSTSPHASIVPEQEEVISVPPTEVRGMPEAEESAPEPTPVFEEEEVRAGDEAKAEPTEEKGIPEAEEVFPVATSIVKEESRLAPLPVTKPEETELASEPLVKSAEASTPVPEAEASTPVPEAEASTPVPEAEEEEIKPAPAPISEQSRKARSRKPGVLVLVLLLLLGIIIGAVFGVYAVGHYGSGSVTPTPSLLHKATSSIHTPTPSPPTPTATTFTSLVGAYYGTIFNLATDVTTRMSLTGIQQNRTAIIGNFTGFNVNAPFSGNIDTSRHIQFTVIGSSGSATLSFDGTMQADGNLAGNYCNLNQQGRCSGGYGLWSVSPVHLPD